MRIKPYFDAGSIQRITEAVGEGYGANVGVLYPELLRVHAEWLVRSELDNVPSERAKRKQFRRVAKTGVALRQALSDEGYATRCLLPGREGEEFLERLDQMIAMVRHWASHKPVRLDRPPKEWFVAEILPTVFERSYGRKAKISRSDPSRDKATVGGPYVRFATAVMKEMGYDISEETVARALKDVRAGRSRRKSNSPRRPAKTGANKRSDAS